MKKYIVMLLSWIFVLSLPLNVNADDRSSIKIMAQYENVTFRLYQIAEITENGSVKMKEPFSVYSVDLNEAGADTALEIYAQRDQILPDRVSVTDQNGEVVFQISENGVYLVSGENILYNNKKIDYAPMLIHVPEKAPDGTSIYQIEAVAKSEEAQMMESCKVRKIWKNAGGKKVEIEVQLLQDGVVADEVALNEKNSWRYFWENLSTESEWKVIEKNVPEGFVLSVEKEENNFILTNTASEETPDEEKEDEGLPQTGQLWWPVSLLAISGIILVLIGLIMSKNSER